MSRSARTLDISSETIVAACEVCPWRVIAGVEEEHLVRRDLLLHTREHPEDPRTWAMRDTHRKWLSRRNIIIPIGAFA